MALSQDQITNLAERMQLVEGLFATIIGALASYQNSPEPVTRQLASQQVRTAIAAMKQVVADPIAALPAAYSEAQIDQLATGLNALRGVATRLVQGLAKAQTPLLVDEDGATVRDYTQVQKDAIETELRRLYTRLTTILNAAPV